MQVQMIVKVRQTKTEATAAQGMAKEVLRPTEEQQAVRIPKTGAPRSQNGHAREDIAGKSPLLQPSAVTIWQEPCPDCYHSLRGSRRRGVCFLLAQ